MKVLQILIVFSVIVFSQENSKSYNQEFTDLILEIEKSQTNFFKNFDSLYYDEDGAREFFDHSVDLISRLKKINNDETIYYKPDEEVLSIDKSRIESIIFHYIFFIGNTISHGTREVDSNYNYVYNEENILYTNKIVDFLFESIIWIEDKYIAERNDKENDEDSFIFTQSIASPYDGYLFPLTKNGLGLDRSYSELMDQLRSNLDMSDFSDLLKNAAASKKVQEMAKETYNNSHSALVYDTQLSFYKGINDNSYPTKDFCGVACEINITSLIRGDPGDPWYIWYQLSYLNFLGDYLTFSQSGEDFQMGLSLNEVFNEMDNTINQIKKIVNGENVYNTRANEIIKDDIETNGYPTVGYSEYNAKTIDEYALLLDIELANETVFTAIELLKNGYEKEGLELFEYVVDVITNVDYPTLSKIAKNDIDSFYDFVDTFSMVRLNIFLLKVLSIASLSEIDTQGLEEEMASEIKSSYMNTFENTQKNIEKIVKQYRLNDYTIQFAKVMDEFLDYAIDKMTKPLFVLDVGRIAKELEKITKPLGADSVPFINSVIFGLMSSHGGLVKLSPSNSYLKLMEDSLLQNPTTEMANEYIDYHLTQISWSVLLENFGIKVNEKTTYQEISEIANDLNLDNLDEEIQKKLDPIIEQVNQAANKILLLTTVNTVQKSPETFSVSMQFLKKMIILSSPESKNESESEDGLYNVILKELIILNKLNTILEYNGPSDIYLMDYLKISEEEFNKVNTDVSYLINNFGIPIVQSFFIEEDFGQLSSVEATYLIKKSERSDFPVSIEKIPFFISSEFAAQSKLLPQKIELLTSGLKNNFNTESTQKELYNIIILPILEELELTDDSNFDMKPYPIIYITDALTHTIPLDALIDNKDQYLLDSFLFIRSNSLLKLTSMDSELLSGKDKKLLLVGDVDYENINSYTSRDKRYEKLDNLEWSSKEINAIKSIYKNSVIYSNLSETNLKKIRFVDFNGLHFSTHGISVYDDFNKSSLFLGIDNENDGILTYNEIKELDLTGIDFVFLSACETNVGKKFTNINPVTLQSAFYQSGVNSSISTLWSINDKATSLFTELFYKIYNTTEYRFIALHQTKRAFISKFPEYNNPYFWAAFTLDGF